MANLALITARVYHLCDQRNSCDVEFLGIVLVVVNVLEGQLADIVL